MHEELKTIFDFSEDLCKLHSFIKCASWTIPITLITVNQINIVNTICSIASYYGVGLEVLRTDYHDSLRKQSHFFSNKDIIENTIQKGEIPFDIAKPASESIKKSKRQVMG